MHARALHNKHNNKHKNTTNRHPEYRVHVRFVQIDPAPDGVAVDTEQNVFAGSFLLLLPAVATDQVAAVRFGSLGENRG